MEKTRSQIWKEVWARPGYKEMMSEKHKARLAIPENKEKNKKSILSWVKSDDHKKKVSKKSQERWDNDDGTWKKKNSESFKKYYLENKDKIKKLSSEIMKKNWEKPEFRTLMMKTILNTFSEGKFKSSNTKIELKVKEYLDELDISYIQQYPLGNKFSCDFGIPELKKIIECDGEYWHSLPTVINKDKYKDEFIRRLGWTILRLPEKIIKDKNLSVEMIKNFIKE